VVLVALAGATYAASRRKPVTADNVNDVPGACRCGGLNEESTMINWGALGAVSLASLAAGVVIVVLVALARRARPSPHSACSRSPPSSSPAWR
jgi:hypothetical protein